MAPLAFLLACDKVPQAGFEPDTANFGTNRSEKEEGRLSPPGGGTAVDEEVVCSVDPQEKVAGEKNLKKKEKWGENPIDNLPRLIRFSTMRSSPMMRMTLGKLEMGVPSSPQ